LPNLKKVVVFLTEFCEKIVRAISFTDERIEENKSFLQKLIISHPYAEILCLRV